MPTRPRTIVPAVRIATTAITQLALALALVWPVPARATFHLNEIDKVMVGYNGDATVQAVELKMLASGENLVSGASLQVYDATGTLVGTLGTFGASLPASGAVAGNRILLATQKFAQTFGIAPDLLIAPGLAATTGQVVFRTSTCLVDAIAYGAVTTFEVGISAAPPLPSSAAAVLVRTVDTGTFPSCPLSDDSGADFQLVTAGPSNPVTFSNNSGASVSVASTVTAVETTISPVRLRISPNPVRTTARIETPRARRVEIFDAAGRLVRIFETPSGATSSIAVRWNGDDREGRPVPSGIYFLRYVGDEDAGVRRFAVVR
ncbi:MAG: T9SS type A sorting domain-containing protein [Hyphomicrobiales bacterium]